VADDARLLKRLIVFTQRGPEDVLKGRQALDEESDRLIGVVRSGI